MSRQEEQFIEIMPITIDQMGKISGSIVFEELGTDKTTMNFFTSELNEDNLQIDNDWLACP